MNVITRKNDINVKYCRYGRNVKIKGLNGEKISGTARIKDYLSLRDMLKVQLTISRNCLLKELKCKYLHPLLEGVKRPH